MDKLSQTQMSETPLVNCWLTLDSKLMLLQNILLMFSVMQTITRLLLTMWILSQHIVILVCFNQTLLFTICKHKSAFTSESSPGAYRVWYNLLKYRPEWSLKVLLALYNLIWTEWRIPKHFVIVAICKTSKDPSPVRTYRPIAFVNWRNGQLWTTLVWEICSVLFELF